MFMRATSTSCRNEENHPAEADLPSRKERTVNHENSDHGLVEVSGRSGMTRAQLLTSAGAGALALAGATRAGAAISSSGWLKTTDLTTGGHVNLWTWANYWAPSDLTGFTKQTQTTINQSNYDSNDQMFAKMNTASASSYDIVVPTSGWIPLMVQRGMLQKLDKSRLPLHYVRTDLQGRNYDPKGDYSVPKDYGVLGVIYDPAHIKTPIRTWKDYLDVGAMPGISGHITCSNTADECVGIGLWSLGYDWNTTDVKKLNQAADVMKAFASHVKAFAAYPTDGMVSGEFVMGVLSHGDARRAMLQKPSLKFVVPGPQSEIWIDSYVITKHAPDLDQAYSFITYMLNPARQITDTQYIGYPTALPGLEKKLPGSVKLKGAIFVSPQVLKRVTSRITRPSTQQLISQLYQKISNG
jgi:spermidine/putrescine transport system substrate-binding protein